MIAAAEVATVYRVPTMKAWYQLPCTIFFVNWDIICTPLTSTHLKSTIQLFLVYSQSCTMISTFSLPQNPCPHEQSFPTPKFPPVQGNHTLTFYGSSYSRHFVYIESYGTWPSVPSFADIALCFQSSRMLQLVSMLHFIYSWIMFHCMERPHFVDLLISWGAIWLFLFFACYE